MIGLIVLALLVSAASVGAAPPADAPDTTAPVTVFLALAPNENNWYSPSVSVELLASDLVPTDTGTGKTTTHTTYYCVNGFVNNTASACIYLTDELLPPHVYAGPITLTEGVSTIRTYSVDEAGNAETVHFKTFQVDSTAPTGQSIVLGTMFEGQSSASIQAELTPGTDALSGVSYCEIQWNPKTAWMNVQLQTTVTNPSGEGLQTVAYRCWDLAGNVSPIVQASVMVPKDTQKPVIDSVTILPDGTSVRGSSLVIQATIVDFDVTDIEPAGVDPASVVATIVHPNDTMDTIPLHWNGSVFEGTYQTLVSFWTGQYDVIVNAQDLAANKATSAKAYFDLTYSLTLDFSFNPSAVTMGNEVLLSGTISRDSDSPVVPLSFPSSIELTLPNGTQTLAVDAETGSFSTAINTTGWTTGVQTITAMVTAANGITTSQSHEVTINPAPLAPEPTPVEPEQSSFSGGGVGDYRKQAQTAPTEQTPVEQPSTPPVAPVAPTVPTLPTEQTTVSNTTPVANEPTGLPTGFISFGALGKQPLGNVVLGILALAAIVTIGVHNVLPRFKK